MAPVRLAPIPINESDGGHMGGHNDAGGHTGDPHIPTTESIATHPEADIHATAHMSHISWGRAGPAVSIKNGAAVKGEYDLVVVGSRSLMYHPEDVKKTERHIFCTVYSNSSGTPVEIARTPWSSLNDPNWSHPVKFQNFAHVLSTHLTILVWSIHHDESEPSKICSLVVGFGTIQSSVLISIRPELAWVHLKMPPSVFEVNVPIVVDLHVGFAGGEYKGADGKYLPESMSDRAGPKDQFGNPNVDSFGQLILGNASSTCMALASVNGSVHQGREVVDGIPHLFNSSSPHTHKAAHYSTDDAEDRMQAVLAFYGFLIIAFYFGIVCAFYIPVEGWTVRECLYFAVVTFTTVGYGDYVPTSDGSKLFTCLVALCGVSFIAVGVGVIGQEVIRVQQKLIEKGKEAASHAVHSQFAEETDADAHDAFAHINEHMQVRPPHSLKIVFWAFFPVITVIGIHATVVGHVEKWSWVDAIYISTITGTSVGYGELYPKEPFSQWFSVFSIPVMVFCISYALGKVAQIPVQHEMNKLHKKMLSCEITEDDFDLMGNGDGDIDRTEFMVHMLKAMKKVDDSLIDKLMDRFNKMDADGSGYISKDELKSVWEKKRVKVEGTAEGEALGLGPKRTWGVVRGVVKGSIQGVPQGSSANRKVRPVQSHMHQVASTKSIVELKAKQRANDRDGSPGPTRGRPRGGSQDSHPPHSNHSRSAAAFGPMNNFGGAM